MNASYFQSLPWDLMDSILEYATLDQGSSPLLCQQTPRQSVAVALLGTCHHWRTFVTSSLCSEYHISLDGSRSAAVISLPRWPKQLSAPSLPLASVVKKVRLNASLWSSLMDGTALQLFSCPQFTDMIFPAAHTLAVSIIDVAGVINCSADELSRAKTFAGKLSRAIRQMVPNVRQVDISWPNIYHVGLKQGLAGLLNSATSALYIGVKRIKFTEYGGFEFPAVIEQTGQTDITHL
ncbi:hypothetical protein LPJ56_006511, partial [Coemansia sp. RSA 2599]